LKTETKKKKKDGKLDLVICERGSQFGTARLLPLLQLPERPGCRFDPSCFSSRAQIAMQSATGASELLLFRGKGKKRSNPF
jgi:hypothetical protein